MTMMMMMIMMEREKWDLIGETGLKESRVLQREPENWS